MLQWIKRIFGIKTLIFVESMARIRSVPETLKDLNALKSGEEWEAIDGVQALTTVTRESGEAVSFNVGSGVLVKAFLNTTTGEIKIFPAKIYGFPAENI